MSVADTFFPWIILVCFIATTYIGYLIGKRNKN